MEKNDISSDILTKKEKYRSSAMLETYACFIEWKQAIGPWGCKTRGTQLYRFKWFFLRFMENADEIKSRVVACVMEVKSS